MSLGFHTINITVNPVFIVGLMQNVNLDLQEPVLIFGQAKKIR
jgi:hypothetical protein